MYHVVMGVAPDDDQAEAKVEAVTTLPGRESVAVTVVHAVDEERDPDPERVADLPSVRLVRERLAAADVESDLVVRRGNPTETLLAVARERDADLVCVAGRRRSPAGKLQLRPGAKAIVLDADVPVLVAGDVD